MRSPGLSRGPIFQSLGSVSLQILSLVSTFQDHSGMPMMKQAMEECPCVLCVILSLPNELTFHWKWARDQELWTACCFRNPERWNKAIIVRSKKTGIKWTFRQLLGHNVLSPMERIMQILPPRSAIKIHIQDVSLQYPRIFQIGLGSLYLTYRANVMEQTFECGSLLLCLWGFPSSHIFMGNS